MKIGICADLQFAEHTRYSRMLPSGITTRLHDQLKCWEWIVKECWECDELFVVGDIFDSRDSINVSVIDVVCRAFHVASKEIKLHVLVGNHDSYLKTPKFNSLQALKGAATVYDKPILLQDLNAAMIPWTDDTDAFRKDIAGASATGCQGSCDYLFTHVLVEGAVPHGRGIPYSWLKADKFKRVFLGDVHEPVDLDEHVHYIGSPMQIDQRDAGGKRGFYIYDTASDELEYIENEISPRFHILEDADTDAVRKGDFVRVKTDDPEIAVEAVEAAQKKTDWVESEIVEVDDTPPRLDVRSKDTHTDVLRKYCKHQELEGDVLERRVKLGLDILEEVKT